MSKTTPAIPANFAANLTDSLDAQRARLIDLGKTAEAIYEIETASGVRFLATPNAAGVLVAFSRGQLPWISRIIADHAPAPKTAAEIEADRIADLRYERTTLEEASIPCSVGNRSWERGSAEAHFKARKAEQVRADAAKAKLAVFDAAHPEIRDAIMAERDEQEAANVAWAMNS